MLQIQQNIAACGRCFHRTTNRIYRQIVPGWCGENTDQRLKDKNLQLNVDTLQDVYQGNYTVNFSGDTLLLKSKTTIIQAHQ